jgi:hypothetical protein
MAAAQSQARKVLIAVQDRCFSEACYDLVYIGCTVMVARSCRSWARYEQQVL